MAPIVIYTPENREINLADPGEADYAMIAALHDQRPPRGSRILLCKRAGFADREMIIRLNPGSLSDYHAAHYPGEGHEGGHPISRPETDEHKRQKEYWRRAATDAGLTVAKEVFIRGAGTMDVVITGDGLIPTDVEVQHSPEQARLIKRRTLRYHAAGYLPVWFSDRRDRPSYLATVPGLSCDDQRWRDYTPARRTVWAIGLGHIRRELRCEVGAFERYRGRCPVAPRRNPCGEVHPEITAGKRALIDDVAAMIPAGELVPLRDFDGTVFMVTATDLARYQEITEGLGGWPGPGSPPRVPQPRRPADPDCRYALHDMPGPAGGLDLADTSDVAGLLQPGELIDLPQPRPESDLAPGAAASGHRARHSRELAGLPELRDGYCPGCRTARLSHGRETCQACSILTIMGYPPAGLA